MANNTELLPFTKKGERKPSPNPTFRKGVPTGLTLPVKTPLLQEGLGEAILARARSRAIKHEQAKEKVGIFSPNAFVV